MTWPVLLEPEAAGLCWKEMLTDIIDAVVGKEEEEEEIKLPLQSNGRKSGEGGKCLSAKLSDC